MKRLRELIAKALGPNPELRIIIVLLAVLIFISARTFHEVHAIDIPDPASPCGSEESDACHVVIDRNP